MNLFRNSREELSKRTRAQDRRLTNVHIVKLAEMISARGMDVIAMKYLNIDWEEIENSKMEHKLDIEGFNHDMIRKWAYRNPGPNQVKV